MDLTLSLGLSAPGAPPAGDTTPGGSSDVWLWEDGIALCWEADIYMLTE